MELKNIRYSALMDCYEGLLTDKRRRFMDLHYNCDLSLNEIAEQESISRQGVHDAIRRGEAQLDELERQLGLRRRGEELRRVTDALERALSGAQISDAARQTLAKLKAFTGE